MRRTLPAYLCDMQVQYANERDCVCSLHQDALKSRKLFSVVCLCNSSVYTLHVSGETLEL